MSPRHHALQVVQGAASQHVGHLGAFAQAGGFEPDLGRSPVRKLEHFAHRRPRAVSTVELFALPRTPVTGKRLRQFPLSFTTTTPVRGNFA